MNMSIDRSVTGLTRREFAAFGGAAILASLLPLGCAEIGSGAIEPSKVPAAADLIREISEDLGNGVVRTTHVIAWKSIPPLGASTTQTVVRTVTPTALGEVMEYRISYDPSLPIAIGTHDTKEVVARYEFVHGPIRGDMREDTLIISGTIDGERAQGTTLRVLRPLRPGGALAELTPRQQLARAIELLNRHGHLPKDSAGALRRIPTGSPAA